MITGAPRASSASLAVCSRRCQENRFSVANPFFQEIKVATDIRELAMSSPGRMPAEKSLEQCQRLDEARGNRQRWLQKMSARPAGPRLPES